MSGTSLDGLDICLVEFGPDGQWEIQAFCCYPYTENWRSRLKSATQSDAEEITRLHIDFAHLQAEYVLRFMQEFNCHADLISAHGHTIFHQPEKHFTLQIGEGETMAALLNIPVVTNFRVQDVALGGQGAPLVPAGEKHLFPEYSLFLNLGGIANIHILNTAAFDICPANMLLNYLIQPLGLPYDDGGKIASSGKMIPELFSQLNKIPYYTQSYPKSLGIEWFEQNIIPCVNDFLNHSLSDLLFTSTCHVAFQTGRVLKNVRGKMLVTGGGALHSFLISKMAEYAPGVDIIVPDQRLIEAKEALVFAWLGYRRYRGEINTLPEHTGAAKAVSAGALSIPPPILP